MNGKKGISNSSSSGTWLHTNSAYTYLTSPNVGADGILSSVNFFSFVRSSCTYCQQDQVKCINGNNSLCNHRFSKTIILSLSIYLVHVQNVRNVSNSTWIKINEICFATLCFCGKLYVTAATATKTTTTITAHILLLARLKLLLDFFFVDRILVLKLISRLVLNKIYDVWLLWTIANPIKSREKTNIINFEMTSFWMKGEKKRASESSATICTMFIRINWKINCSVQCINNARCLDFGN